MHRYDEASETMYFKRHKLKMAIPTKITGANIEQPTDEDLEWAKKTYNTKRSQFFDDMPKPANLWRIGFLITIPNHGAMHNYGFDDDLKRKLITHYADIENLDAVKLCAQYSQSYVQRGALLHALRENKSPDFTIEVISHLSSISKDLCDNEYVFQAAVERGDLTIMKSLYESGADIVTGHQAKIEFALSKQQPEVARFLTDTYDQIQEKAGLKDKAKPTLKTSNGDKWERMGENQIAKHSTFDEGKQSLTEIFNFDSQQVITVQNNARLNTSSSFAQNFKDIQNQDYIKAAATELVNLGGSRTETPVKLSLPLKAQT